MENLPFILVRGAKMGLADQLTDGLRSAILTGVYRRGSVLPTRETLMAAFGVSERVPRMAFARLAAEGLVVPRPGIGCQVVGARSRAWNGQVLLAVTEDGSPYYAVFSAAMRKRLMQHGWLLTRMSFGDARSPRMKNSELDLMLSRPYSLAVLMLTMPGYGRVEKRFEQMGVPYLAYSVSGAACRGRAGSIVISIEDAIAKFVSHCRASGIRRVLQVGCGRNGTVDVVEPLRNAGMAVDEIVCSANVPRLSLAGFQRAGVVALGAWLKKHAGNLPDIVFFSDDILAGAAFPVLLEAGLRVPEDIKVATFSNFGIGPVWRKDFTRIEADAAKDGEAVADGVLSMLSGLSARPEVVLHRKYLSGDTFPLS